MNKNKWLFTHKFNTVIEDSFTPENSEQAEEKEPTQEVDSKETTE